MGNLLRSPAESKGDARPRCTCSARIFRIAGKATGYEINLLIEHGSQPVDAANKCAFAAADHAHAQLTLPRVHRSFHFLALSNYDSPNICRFLS